MIVENELGLYEGCYVELRNGEILGPLENDGDPDYPWNPVNMILPAWTPNGTYCKSGVAHQFDVVRILPPKGATAEPQTEPAPVKQGMSEAVLKAAMDAGIRAKPAYEDFVTAIVQAAFAEAGKPVAPTLDRREVFNAIREKLVVNHRLIPPATCTELARHAIHALEVISPMIFGHTAEPKNESAPGSDAVRKNEGGQSDLEDISPSEYHGITSAEQERLIDKIRLNAEYPPYAPAQLHFYDPKLTGKITASAQGTLEALCKNLSSGMGMIYEEWCRGLSIQADGRLGWSPENESASGSNAVQKNEGVQSEPAVNLVEPEGWYLCGARHEHIVDPRDWRKVIPTKYPAGQWTVSFQSTSGGPVRSGRGHNLCEAWENAVKAVAERQS